MYKQLGALFPQNKNGIVQSISQVLKKFSTQVEEIIVPKAIPRGSTDILKALSGTVNTDPTAAHYKYHDDPYLIPYSNLSKRSFALAQEAGRKAAQWVREQHPELFQHRVADPVVEAFLPKPVYDDKSNVNEEILKNSILNICISDSITIYGLLKKNGIDISAETKQNLLELLCYYNSQDPFHEDWIEERWFRQGTKSRERLKNVWKDRGFAEELFQEIGSNNKSMCALISGMSKHGQIDKAWNLYEQAISNGYKLNAVTYNALLAVTCFLKESHVMVLQCLQELLQKMNSNKIQPNLFTMNAVLESLSNISSNKSAKQFALEIIAEFNSFGIKPSLASFYHLNKLYANEAAELRGVMISCFDYLENNKIEIQDIKDVMFFSSSMELICNRLYDKNLAERLNTLLHKDDNYNFIGDSYKESLYYRYYFILLCKNESLDAFMEIYDNLVPNIYIPEPTVMKAILNSVENYSAWNLLPRLWSDIVLFEQGDRIEIFERLLSLAVMNNDEALTNDLANTGWSMWEKIEESAETRRPLDWTGPLLGNLLMILLMNNDLSKAHIVLDKLDILQNKIIGEPKVDAFIKYIDICIKEQSPDAALKCIRISNDIGFLETDELARKLYSSLQLGNQQIERLINIVGKDALKMKQPLEKVVN